MPELKTIFIRPFLKITRELINSILYDLITEESDFIEELVKSQLSHGIDGTGSLITPPYAPYTVAMKRAEGKEADFVTLYDTGAVYDDIFVQVFSEAFSQDSTDSKVPELKAKYGGEIFDLTEESKDKLLQYLKPKFIDRLQTAVGL